MLRINWVSPHGPVALALGLATVEGLKDRTVDNTSIGRIPQAYSVVAVLDE